MPGFIRKRGQSRREGFGAQAWAYRHSIALRWVLAGPGAMTGAIAIMAAMPIWLPVGSAGIDHLILPLILFPALWATLFFYTVLENSLPRAVFVMLAIIGVNIAAAFWMIRFSGLS